MCDAISNPRTTVPPTTVPETAVPETAVPETAVPETTGSLTTVPESTVPETTGPPTTVSETTVPGTTVPETTVPETTSPRTTTPSTILEDILDGPPSTTWRDFRHAKLRQFPAHDAKIQWLEYLGHGEQGIVYKAAIGGLNPVAIKVFWRTLKPERRRPGDWPFEEECRTVATLEKIKSVMSKPDHSVKIMIRPGRREEAARNLFAFSDECRQLQRPSKRCTKDPPPLPPLPVCYGWMKVHHSQLPLLDRPVRWWLDDHRDWHWAIVYEFVPKQKQDLEVAQKHLDFFWSVGFPLEPYKPDNWHGGRLIDYNDVCSPVSSRWFGALLHEPKATEWFWTLDFSTCSFPPPPRRIIRQRQR